MNGELNKARILVAEGDPRIGADIRDRLVAVGYEVAAVVESGEDAAAKAVDLAPDLVLIDISLAGGMDGVRAAGEILSRIDLPIVYMAERIDREIISRAGNTAPYGYITRRAADEVLFAAVATAIDRHADRAARERGRPGLRTDATRALLDSVFAAIPDQMLVIDRDMRIVMSNWDRWECSEKNRTAAGSICYEFLMERTAPCAACPVSRVFSSGKAVHVREMNPRTKKMNEIRAFPIFDERGEVAMVVEHLRDITEQLRMESALCENEERMRRILDSTDDGYYEWNVVTGEIFLSDRYFTLNGYEPGELSSSFDEWLNHVHPDDREYALNLVLQHLQGKSENYYAEYRMRTKQGGWIWIADRGKIMERDGEGNPVRFAGAHLDITRRREAEDRLKESLLEKEVLLRETHHRVKNNFQIIISLLSLQASGLRDRALQEQIEEAKNRIRSMALIHEKLYRSGEMTRIDFGSYLRSISDDLSRVYSGEAPAAELSVECQNLFLEIDQAIPCGLIVNELLTNCFKYAFPAGWGNKGLIRVSLAEDDGGMVTLVVSDNGIGMPADTGVDPPATLGLSLVSMLVRQLDGTFEIGRSGGTTFTIRFARSGAV